MFNKLHLQSWLERNFKEDLLTLKQNKKMLAYV